jgi:SAM-dependent methyltransferase
MQLVTQKYSPAADCGLPLCLMKMRNIYDDARHYDALFPGPNDLPFYRRHIATSGGPVIELACGSGRLTIPLAADGVEITGLDQSSSMLEAARRRAAQENVQASFHQGDMRNFDLGQKFNLIFISTNSFCHLLDLDGVESCLRTARNHLAPEGRFIIDIFTPSARMLARSESEAASVGEYDDPDGKGRIFVIETHHYNVATQVNHSTWRFTNRDTGESWQQPFNLRMFYPQEIDALLHYNGFTIENKFGWYDETPYGEGAPKQLIVSYLTAAF